jgi:hypothetical protein
MIRTWKGIAIALSGDGPVMDVRTARAIARQFKMPVVKLNRTVCIPKAVFDRWAAGLCWFTYGELKES